MSIYVIRRDNQYKIGFSDSVAERVHSLVAAMPKGAIALGCMPGGREVEAHLHEVFASTHIGAEWFGESEALLTFVAICLVPVPAPTLATERREPRADRQQLSEALRDISAVLWPKMNNTQRTAALAEQTGIGLRRMKSLYLPEQYKLTPSDVSLLEPFLNKHGVPVFELARAAEARAKLAARRNSKNPLVRFISRVAGGTGDWIAPELRPPTASR